MKEMISEGSYNDWNIYKNKDGFMEGYMKVGKTKPDCKRIISNQTTVAGFIAYVEGLKPKRGVQPLKAKDLPALPFPE